MQIERTSNMVSMLEEVALSYDIFLLWKKINKIVLNVTEELGK